MSYINNNNRRINFLTTKIGQQKKNLVHKVSPLFKNSKSEEVLEILEILERKLLNFIKTLTFENLKEKLIELQKIYQTIRNIYEKILAKQDETLLHRIQVIYDNYFKLFPNFSDKILNFLNSKDLNNLAYLSFIIDNLMILFFKFFSQSEEFFSQSEDNPYYKKMLEVQTQISYNIDKLTNKNKKNNFNNKNINKLENEQNEYMLREKIVALSLKIYNKALKSKGKELEKLKEYINFLIELYKKKFIYPRKNQLFPINQNTLDKFDIFKNIPSSNNSNLAAGLANLSIKSKKNTPNSEQLYYA
jgi:hypothetical protein